MYNQKSVVLIKAPCLESYGSLNTGNHILPLGLLYLHAHLKKQNVNSYLLDPEAECINDDGLISLISEKDPLLIGITCCTSNYLQARRLAGLVKRHFRKTFIILGGPHASAVPEVTLQLDGDKFDFVCIGEGEETIFQLFQALSEGRDLNTINGLAFISDGKTHINGPRSLINNLDDIPFPSWDQVDLSKYSPRANLNKGMPSAVMITSRGCPFKCDYCQSKLVLGRKIRFNSAEYVLEQIEDLYHHHGFRYFRFVDDVFTVNHDRLKKIMEGIRKKELNIKFWCMARANMIDEETIRLLKSGGLDSISIGVESGDDEILKGIGKDITRKDAENAFALLKKHHVEAQAFFMIGFYHDTHETIMRTIRFAVQLDPDFVSYAVMIPYPGTPVYKKYYKNKIDFSQPEVWRYFTAVGGDLAGFGNKNFSREELMKFMRLGFRRFYFRPGKIFQLIRKINSFDQLKEYLNAGLVVIYNKQK